MGGGGRRSHHETVYETTNTHETNHINNIKDLENIMHQTDTHVNIHNGNTADGGEVKMHNSVNAGKSIYKLNLQNLFLSDIASGLNEFAKAGNDVLGVAN